ncbi:Small subunit (SSU) processome component [Malassezia cuniculi]|uniref:Small subunit (SSU) processome component n=1 Tax=Malassezia cuniculi TaxID=948313 RepID=A0AAF0ENU6_9BASI|nr:Small subunit (SSU) processome component [Malassezia cuniculi]
MAKSKAQKPPKSRPASTSALAQPLQTSRTCLTAFAPGAGLFAHVAQAVDRHRVRVFSTDSTAVADYLLPESLACRTLAWTSVEAPAPDASKKKRKGARKSADGARRVPLLALGMADGSVLLFSPQQAKVVRVLASVSPDATNSSIVSLSAGDLLWGVTASGWVQGWDLSNDDERAPPVTHFLADQKQPVSLVSASERLVAAHHAIALFSLEDKPAPLGSYTGHITPVTHAVWTGASGFVTAAADDRSVYYWSTEDAGARAAQPRAMAALDAPPRVVVAHDGLVVISTARGTIRVYRVPQTSAGTVAQLDEVARVAVVGGEATDIVDAEFAGDSLRFARLVKGVKVVLDDAVFRRNGSILETVTVQCGVSRREEPSDAAPQRYREAAGSAGQRAELPGHTAEAAGLLGTEGGLLPSSEAAGAHDDALLAENELVDEPTLAQRLKALKVQRGEAGDDDEDKGSVPVGGASLASSLTQALHSGDHALLSATLVHSDPTLIRATVRRISGPLAVRLLEACVERLNRGGVKSRGALGSARARGIVEWIHQTLTCHTTYLMSLPHLVARLASLHHSLAARLASHERLLSLRGRLELVMSQIDMQMTYTADDTPIEVQGQKLGRRSAAADIERRAAAESARTQGQTWVEGEDVEDIEDVGLGAGSDDEVEDIEMDDDEMEDVDDDDDEDVDEEDEEDDEEDEDEDEDVDDDDDDDDDDQVSEDSDGMLDIEADEDD